MKHALQHQLDTADLEQVLKNVWGSEADLNIVLTLFQGFQGSWFLAEAAHIFSELAGSGTGSRRAQKRTGR